MKSFVRKFGYDMVCAIEGSKMQWGDSTSPLATLYSVI